MPDIEKSADKEIKKRVDKHEKAFSFLRGAGAVAGVVLPLLFGVAAYYIIPHEVAKRLPKAITDYAKEADRGLWRNLRIESGEIAIHHDNFPDLRRTNTGKDRRGAIDKKVTFNKPFQSTPNVIVALKSIDHVLKKMDGKVTINNLRIKASVSEINKEGFTYSLSTWAKTDIWSASLSWVAYGRD